MNQPDVVVNCLELPVTNLGQDGEHIEGAPIAHVQTVGLDVVLPGPPVVGRWVHLQDDKNQMEQSFPYVIKIGGTLGMSFILYIQDIFSPPPKNKFSKNRKPKNDWNKNTE